MANLNALNFTPDQLDAMAVITDADLAIAATEITKLLSPKYANLLLALPEDIDDAPTNEPESRPATE